MSGPSGTSEVVLQIVPWDSAERRFEARSSRRCERYSIAGLARPTRILIGDCGGTGDAQRLYDELAAHLGAAQTARPQHCGGPVWPGCWTESNQDCAQVLVLVLGPAYPRGLEARALEWTERFGSHAAVIPLVQNNQASNVTLPRRLGRWQVSYWLASPRECAIDILRSAGVGAGRRLFISYIRREAEGFSHHLWRSLTDAGLDVFLDRRSLNVGRTFPEQIRERIARSEALVVLETPSISSSEWVGREVSVARAVGLGVIVIGQTGRPDIVRVAARDRLSVAPSAWTRPNAAALDRCVRFIDERSAMASLRARCLCEQALRTTARQSGLSVTPVTPGVFSVNGVFVAPRGQPATISDLRLLERARGRLPNIPAVAIGEHHLLEGDARADLIWAAQSANVRLRRRRDLLRSLAGIAQGAMP
jgi:hypothetical protein